MDHFRLVLNETYVVKGGKDSSFSLISGN